MLSDTSCLYILVLRSPFFFLDCNKNHSPIHKTMNVYSKKLSFDVNISMVPTTLSQSPDVSFSLSIFLTFLFLLSSPFNTHRSSLAGETSQIELL